MSIKIEQLDCGEKNAFPINSSLIKTEILSKTKQINQKQSKKAFSTTNKSKKSINIPFKQTAEYIIVKAPENTSDNYSFKQTRYVKPYIQEFVTFAKGRWLGRELIEVLTREFGGHPFSYWKNAIKNGFVRVNNNKVDEKYRFKNSDALLHRTHR
jgi:tRNA pseudouridine synthase 9